MATGKIKKMFPGGNTIYGFYSFFDYIVDPDATRVFIIKGGPGTGKSTFMKAIGQVLVNEGLDIEYHYCSSDSESLDGLAVPELKLGIMDGTAPHVNDPKTPGAIDEIINLGDYWKTENIIRSKNEIININKTVKKLFGLVYLSLKQANAIRDELESYYIDVMNFNEVNRVTNEISEELFGGVKPQYRHKPRERHLYAFAITPEGVVNHIDTLLSDVEKLYLISGGPGTGKATLIGKIANRAKEIGLDTEVYHSGFDPKEVDLVIIPSIKAAVLNNTKPRNLDSVLLENKSVKEIDLTEFANKSQFDSYERDFMSADRRFWSAFNRAIKYLRTIKQKRKPLEAAYIRSMDFKAIDKKRDELIEKILSYKKSFK
ncbi:MAG: hypothetical protein PWQ82_1666 [Thermosediminibacterales bacterium]|nr:hypothetical protein [Thermosediminibacterales bacterium]